MRTPNPGPLHHATFRVVTLAKPTGPSAGCAGAATWASPTGTLSQVQLGAEAGEAILGAKVFKNLFADIRDIVGGRSATYQCELQRAQENALTELAERASGLGANAVAGIRLDYEVIGQCGRMPMTSASGTAVVVEYRRCLRSCSRRR